LTESDPPQPVSKYGESKLRGEQAAFEFAEVVPISIVRSPIVFGEGDLDGLALFSCIAKTRLHTSPTFRRHRYSFIHAADLGKAMSLVAEKGDRLTSKQSDRGIYFVAAEKNPTFAEYGRLIADSMGIERILALPVPPMAIRVVGGCNELFSRLSGRAHIFTWDKTREALAGSWACSPARLNSDLGFRTDLSLEDRLAETVRWYVDQGYLPPKVLRGQATTVATDRKPADSSRYDRGQLMQDDSRSL
jgi:nucleoside-diphosphate-sugar epimerase